MNVAIIGSGYVGLVTGTCLAEVGHKVICVDNDDKKIKTLKKGKIPIYEPDLGKLVRKNLEKNLFFTTSVKEAVDKSEVIFIAVNTPPKKNGEADLCYVEAVSREVAQHMGSYKVIVEKSTVPVETGKWIKKTIELNLKKGVEFDVVSNPEFLREGSAVEDFMYPDRIVIGVESDRAEKIMRELYKPYKAPIIITDRESAEIIKHASNSFLSLKISYINAIANICELVGADVKKVAEGMGLDKRIGRAFLDAGAGFGGSCFPKDLSAFIRIAEKIGYNFELLKIVEAINVEQKKLMVKKVEDMLWNINGKKIGVLGLSFKPNTDDMRNAPSIDIIHMLQKEGANIKAYDPQAMDKAKPLIKDIKYCKDAYEAADKSDALLLLTEWDEFKNLDFNKIKGLMKTPVIVDGRNMFDSEKLMAMGFMYMEVGRGRKQEK